MNIIKELNILAKTGFIEQEVKNLPQTLIFIAKVFVFAFLLNLLPIAIKGFLAYNNIFKIPNNVGHETLDHYSLLGKFLFVCLHAPIVEELACRIGLKFSKLNLSLMVFAITFFISTTLKISFFWLIIISVTCGISTYIVLSRIRIFNFTRKLWTENRKIIFYTLLLIFSFTHLINYDITMELLLFSPIVIMPQLIGGFIFSYVRLKTGITEAILLHSLNNFIPFVILNII